MRIGIATEETWDFLHDVYADLCEHHQVSVFKRRFTRLPFFKERTNRALFQQDMSHFLKSNQVVFFEWASELLVAASHLPKTCGIVTRLHRYEMYQWVDQIHWDNVDKIILVSKAKQAEFIKKFPAQAEKTSVIPVAVSLNKYTFQPHPFTGEIGILCHIAPRKRVYELILDFYEIQQQNHAFHLHIAGSLKPSQGAYHEAMQTMVTRLGIQENVTFYGRVNDAWNWYHNIDIFVSNSYSEGLQVALMEAMASGCYCLSHHWAGAEEILPEDNLYYTGKALQEKILAFAAKSDTEKLALKTQMQQIAHQSFDVERTKKQTREIIEQTGAAWA